MGTVDYSCVHDTFFCGGLPSPSWSVKWSDLSLSKKLAHGATGNFFVATWNQTIVVVEVLTNQSLSETDAIHLMRDQLILR